MKHLFSLCHIALLVLLCTSALSAQDSLRYRRLFLRDKGTQARVLTPGDPLYAQASAHLTARALERRAKVLPAGELVSTDDLPVFAPYLSAIAETGATIVETSRWLNTVMVIADSATYEDLRFLPFLDSLNTLSTRRISAGTPFGKSLVLPALNAAATAPTQSDMSTTCITELYGYAAWQNTMMGIDFAHRLGLAGNGVLVGVLDAGFDWRGHAALRDLNVIAEHDFVFDDDNAFDEAGESGAESHGTAVMSMIGGYLKSTLVGGAPQASFILAKTEDVRGERNVEEDYFVAGLEWMEALGVDVTNTSLGYTQFDVPEISHDYRELNGHTAQASRGLNHAVRLGVVCCVAAGNEAGAGKYNYVSVPAEADSAIAVAAADSSGNVARFSSRGFSGRARIKPDIAGFGVGNWGASWSDTLKLTTGQGTSYASPMVAGTVAILLSARPSLTPYQVRALLQATASRATSPDTALGYGVVNVARALEELSRSAPVVGMPRVQRVGDHIAIAAGTLYEKGRMQAEQGSGTLPTMYLTLRVRNLETGRDTAITTQQPFSGIARWYLPLSGAMQGNRLELAMQSSADQAIIRRDTFILQGEIDWLLTHDIKDQIATSTLCESAGHGEMPVTAVATATPNPFRHFTVIEFQTEARATVSLTVYNTLGEEVARLIDHTEMEPGFHTSFFQPAGLPTGAYHYSLRVGDAVRSEQMIYMP